MSTPSKDSSMTGIAFSSSSRLNLARMLPAILLALPLIETARVSIRLKVLDWLEVIAQLNTARAMAGISRFLISAGATRQSPKIFFDSVHPDSFKLLSTVSVISGSNRLMETQNRRLKSIAISCTKRPVALLWSGIHLRTRLLSLPSSRATICSSLSSFPLGSRTMTLLLA